MNRPIKLLTAGAQCLEQDVAGPLAELQMVRVEVFENFSEGKKGDIHNLISELVDRLKKKQGWTPVVSVSENGGSVNILTRIKDNLIAGFVLIIAEKDQLVFVNLVGNMTPENLGKQVGMIGKKFMNGETDLAQLSRMFGNFGATAASEQPEATQLEKVEQN